jgi:hypothetical protein
MLVDIGTLTVEKIILITAFVSALGYLVVFLLESKK